MAKKNEQKETKQDNDNALFSVYGARLSKSGERVNVSLVRGKDDAREWATISIKMNKSDAKVKVKIEGDFAYIKIPMLKQDTGKKDADALDF